MSAIKLLRFLNKEQGPVTGITSVPYPGLWNARLWHSTATLHHAYVLPDSGRVLVSAGSGWSPDREESQAKAVTEAVERWAYSLYQKNVCAAALDKDNTTTGFAALPEEAPAAQLILNAYSEAVERWAVSSIWDAANIPLTEAEADPGVFQKLFKKLDGRLHCFRTGLKTLGAPVPAGDTLEFCLYVFETAQGGAVPGSACGDNWGIVSQRALTEVFTHATAFRRLEKQRPAVISNILERRLLRFGADPGGFVKVVERFWCVSGKLMPETPPVIFSSQLTGPWNPEISIHRVVLKDSPPFVSGGEERFVI